MNLKIVLLGAALMLGGCASPSPTVKLNQPPREVSEEDLCLYWVQEGEMTHSTCPSNGL
ncbi:hypothetical protein [Aeromonas rivipollensis]